MSSGGGIGLLDLRPHQREALAEIEKAIGVSSGDSRTQCRMACGTGKTFVGLRAVEALAPKSSLVALPTLALAAQTLQEYRLKGVRDDVEYVVVCSDQTVAAKSNEDELSIDLADLNARVTNSESELSSILKAKRSRPLVVMSTLHSLPIISNVQQRVSSSKFELSIVDEAHKTTGREGSTFGLIHDSTQFRSDRRLYMTATARFYEGEDEVYSMDDETVFGSVCYSLPFAEAVSRKLLTDYRVLMPMIQDTDSRYAGLDRNSLATSVLLKAIEEHDIRKVITFHKDTKNADACSRLLGSLKHKKHPIWTRHINGKMTTQLRGEILNQFGRQSRDHISITTNCKCLTEGIDVPTLDAVAFYDPRNSEVDIAQALGRAVRKAPGKKYGYFIIPLIISYDTDAEGYLHSSEFKKIGQVIRALKAFDDSFEGKLRSMSESRSVRGLNQGSELFQFGKKIDAELIKNIKTKIVNIGLRAIRKELNNELVIEAARAYYKEHGELPDKRSKLPVPGLPDESWSSIAQAGLANARGLKGSLHVILEPLRQELKISHRADKKQLSNQIVIDAARKYYKKHKKLPSAATLDPVPGLPGETWKAIDLSGRLNKRNLTGSLSTILEPLRKELGLVGLKDRKNISKDMVLKAARAHYKLHGVLPTITTPGEVLGLPGDTWKNIFVMAQRRQRGLKENISVMFNSLRRELNLPITTGRADLSDTRVRLAARKFYKLHKYLPTSKTTEPVPGMPDESWAAINNAGIDKKRGLSASLSVILQPLKVEFELDKKEIILSNKQVQDAAREYFILKGKLPHATTKDPVPGMPDQTWASLDRAGRNNRRGLKGPLAQILRPLREELGLSKK